MPQNKYLPIYYDNVDILGNVETYFNAMFTKDFHHIKKGRKYEKIQVLFGVNATWIECFEDDEIVEKIKHDKINR